MAKAKLSDGVALIPAVGYIRMSTDDQKDSPERQRGEIVTMAERSGYRIIRWYEDHGISGTESKNRPQFQQMLKDAPKREFKAILVYEPSRFSRESVLEAAKHWSVLEDNGVVLVSVTKGVADFNDVADLVMQVIGQHQSRGESITFAERSLSGKKRKANAGIYQGMPPFGFEREIRDESGKVVKRITCWERFRTPKSWTSKLVPSSDKKVLDAVRFMFNSVIEGVSCRQIAFAINAQGFRGAAGQLFNSNKVRSILTNPKYKGVLVFGARPSGKFVTCNETIIVNDAHQGFVSVEVFDKVQTLLKSSYRKMGVAEPGKYLLGSMVYCEHCGRRLTAANVWGKLFPDGRRQYPEGYRQYRCGVTRTGIEACDVRPAVGAATLEELVIRFVREKVLCEANRKNLLHWARIMTRGKQGPSRDELELDGVRQKIVVGESRLIDSNDATFGALSRLLVELRQKETRLVERIKAMQSEDISGPLLDAIASPEALNTLRDNLLKAPRHLLKSALFSTIDRVTVGRIFNEETAPTKQAFGTVVFREDVYHGGPVHFTEADLWPDEHYLSIAEYVKKVGRAVPTEELANELELPRQTALYHARRAHKAGLVKMARANESMTFAPVV